MAENLCSESFGRQAAALAGNITSGHVHFVYACRLHVAIGRDLACTKQRLQASNGALEDDMMRCAGWLGRRHISKFSFFPILCHNVMLKIIAAHNAGKLEVDVL